MAKDARDGYQKMAELRDDLKAVLRESSGGAAETTIIAPPRHQGGSGAVARAVRWLRTVTSSAPPGGTPAHTSQEPQETPVTSFTDHQKKSVAILPFKNLSNDPASSFYEFSLADAVTTELARLRSLVVRPSSVKLVTGVS